MHAGSPIPSNLEAGGFTSLQCRARVTSVRAILALLVAACAMSTACSRAREYELRGQVLAIDLGRQEITIKHADIRGFMPGMTMPFKVRDARLLEGRQAGDLVKATLVVENSSGYLSSLERTGHEALSEPPPLPRIDLIEPGQQVPDVQLVDEAGAGRRLSEWSGRVVAVTFTYTSCRLPDFCLRMDQHFKKVQEQILADPGLRDRAALLSVSVDPEVDTPEVLSLHARQMGADPRVWHFATGERDAIGSFAARFGISIFRNTSDATDITHNLRTAVIGSDGALTKVLGGNEWTPTDLLNALRQAH